MSSRTQRPRERVFAQCSAETLMVTHIFDGEEVVTGGEDGQTWVATFSSPVMARQFIEWCKQVGGNVNGERG